jgi:hypothetical protein
VAAEPISRAPDPSQRTLVQRFDPRRLMLVDHHEAHAAGAAWASGFGDCGVLTIDGLGDGASATISTFRSGRLQRMAVSPARCSLGVFFEHVTGLLNMRELEDEGKVMALADYAAPIADDENPLLDCVRVQDGDQTARPGHAQRRAGADSLARANVSCIHGAAVVERTDRTPETPCASGGSGSSGRGRPCVKAAARSGPPGVDDARVSHMGDGDSRSGRPFLRPEDRRMA